MQFVQPAEMDAAQREVYEEALATKSGKAPAPMLVWLKSPELARHATRLGRVLRYDTLFPARLSEVAILVTARHWNSHYEWFAHKDAALKAGVDPDVIEAIRTRRTPVFDDVKARVIYDVARSLHEGKGLSQALFDEAVSVLTERGLVEVIGLCGNYSLVAMTLAAFEFPLPDGEVSGLD
ncbi:MAG TPA: carboxymuconolactone decarboxylase family protein [Burkholderiaceae bacterium]|nr:carboxymuconolactone decarboxylase family protein [Burkholderiaceae bacterium]